MTTRVGTIDLRVPRDRDGSFSTELFERYQRSEKALVPALMEMVVNGVSTREVKNITEELCGREFAKSTISDLSKDLDEQFFRARRVFFELAGVTMAETPVTPRRREHSEPPGPGEHTREGFGEVGYSEDEIDELAESGAI